MPRARKTARLLVGAVLATVGSISAVGCSNGIEGSLFGAGLGAGGGAIIGSMFGEAGTGAVIGAVSGALAGAVIGDQNERADRRAYAPRYASDYDYYDRAPRDAWSSRTYERHETHYYRSYGRHGRWCD